jgi:hypothetical protein
LSIEDIEKLEGTQEDPVEKDTIASLIQIRKQENRPHEDIDACKNVWCLNKACDGKVRSLTIAQ